MDIPYATSLRYIEMVAYGVPIRLLKGNSIQINGVMSNSDLIIAAPMQINGIKIFFSGGTLVLAADFGVTIYWNNGKFDITLCDAYSGFICGLCGNYDGEFSNSRLLSVK